MKHFAFILLLAHSSWSNTSHNSTNLFIQRIKSKSLSWKLTDNLDQDPTEFLKSRLGFLGTHPDPNFQIETKTSQKGRRIIIPETFDAREQWPTCRDVINNIRDQGKCGSCYAFSAAEVLSDRLCIQTEGKVKVTLSPQQVISCCSTCGYGCDGGYTYLTWTSFYFEGIVTGGDYNTDDGCKPYEAPAYLNNTASSCKNSCTNQNYTTPYTKDRYFGKEYYRLAENDVTLIQTEILSNGPVQASYRVYQDFGLYNEGVYHHVEGEDLGGHAVKIIGWGTENNEPYWLVANSWGVEWANLNGFFKIRRGANECGIEGSVVAGLPRVPQDSESDNKLGGSSIHVACSLLVLISSLFALN